MAEHIIQYRNLSLRASPPVSPLAQIHHLARGPAAGGSHRGRAGGQSDSCGRSRQVSVGGLGGVDLNHGEGAEAHEGDTSGPHDPEEHLQRATHRKTANDGG